MMRRSITLCAVNNVMIHTGTWRH